MSVILIILAIYLSFHIGNVYANIRSRYAWYKRLWIIVTGPFYKKDKLWNHILQKIAVIIVYMNMVALIIVIAQNVMVKI